MSKFVDPFNPSRYQHSSITAMLDESSRKWSAAHRCLLFILLSSLCLATSACSKKQAPATAEQPAKQEPPPASNSLAPDEGAGSGKGTLVLPTGFGKRTGDLDEMVKNRAIRALILVNRISFFYQQGRPQGIQYEALQEFEKFVNQKEKTGRLPVKVDFLPMRPDQLEPALTQGLGDMIAYGVVITPEREQRVAFSVPIQKNVPQIVVTGPALASVSSFDEMGGKAIYVNPVTTYYENLKKVSDAQQKAHEHLPHSGVCKACRCICADTASLRPAQAVVAGASFRVLRLRQPNIIGSRLLSLHPEYQKGGSRFETS